MNVRFQRVGEVFSVMMTEQVSISEDFEASRKGHRGLANMSERMALIGEGWGTRLPVQEPW